MAVPYTRVIVGFNTRRTNLQTPFAVSMLCFSQFPPILLHISAERLPYSRVLWLNDALGNRFFLKCVFFSALVISQGLGVFFKGLAAYRQTHLMPLVYLATDGTLLSDLLMLLQGADMCGKMCAMRRQRDSQTGAGLGVSLACGLTFINATREQHSGSQRS